VNQKVRVIVGLATLLALSPSAAAGLQQNAPNATEETIVEAVDAGNDSGLSLLERIVNINSGTMNFGGVRAVGDILRTEFDALGFQTRWVDGTGFGRSGHLIAERRGHGPKLLLIGHLDTVFEPDHPFQRFTLLSDTTARGPGIIDMKGGDVIIVQALKALAAAGVLDGMSITVVLHGDEESSGRPLNLARRDLIEAARTADIAIGFEDGDGNPRTAVVARRGAGGWVLRTQGTPAHSSQIFKHSVGHGAVFEAARILEAFRTKLSGEALLTFNPGVAVGGTAVTLDEKEGRGTGFGKTNVVAEHMIVQGDVRTISTEQLERTKAAMRAIVEKHLPQTSAEITFDDGYPGMAPTEGHYRLLRTYSQVSKDLGFGEVTAVDPGSAGAADISFTAGLVSMALDGLGLSGVDGHTAGETADLRTLPTLTKRAAVLLYRLTRSPGTH
jgi:glutamate carboxypeptidase